MLCKYFDFIKVGEEKQEMVAGLYLLLACQLVEFLFSGLIRDVDYRKLLSVVACGGVADGLVDEGHVVVRYVFAFVAADAAPLKKGLVYRFHCLEL